MGAALFTEARDRLSRAYRFEQRLDDSARASAAVLAKGGPAAVIC